MTGMAKTFVIGFLILLFTLMNLFFIFVGLMSVEMGIVETMIILMVIFFMYLIMGFYIMWTLMNHNLQTLFVCSLPFLRGNRVLDFHFMKNRTFKLNLLPVVGNEMQQYKIEDGKKKLLNKKIKKGTFWKEMSSGTISFFTADGHPETFDPMENRQGFNDMLEDIIKMAFNAGLEWAEILRRSNEPKKLTGWSLYVVAGLLIIFIAVMIGLQIGVSGQLGAMADAIIELQGLIQGG